MKVNVRSWALFSFNTLFQSGYSLSLPSSGKLDFYFLVLFGAFWCFFVSKKSKKKTSPLLFFLAFATVQKSTKKVQNFGMFPEKIVKKY